MYFYSSKNDNYIIHYTESANRYKKYKYIAKVDLGNGVYRYFYDQDEWDAYKKRAQKQADKEYNTALSKANRSHDDEGALDATKVVNAKYAALEKATKQEYSKLDTIANTVRDGAEFVSNNLNSTVKTVGNTIKRKLKK